MTTTGNSGGATPCGGHDNDDQCVVLGRWGDWLWLNPIGYRNATPFTAHIYAYYIVKSAEPQQWPNR
jgi:hypothetical protein